MTKVRLAAEATGLRLLVLDDPDRRNAIDRAMRADLAAAVDTVARDPAARVLVVTGAGTAFCAGGDLPDLLGTADRPIAELRADLMEVYDSFLSIRRLGIPSIAAVHGPAVGAGLNLAMSCDLRIMGPRGYLDPNFTRIGIHPGGGATAFLVRALGAPATLEVLLSATRIDAGRAVACGLAGSVADDPLAAARELAERICALDPALVRDVRATVRTAARTDLATAIQAESWAQAASILRNPAILTPRRGHRAPGTSPPPTGSRPT